MPAEPERFAALFKEPTVEKMHALTPREFERFVAYVLRRAGYQVNEVGPHFLRGVDLEIRLPGKTRVFGGVECKRYAPGRLVAASTVRGVRGAPAVDRQGAKPFVITTSDFNEPAHQMAEAGTRPVYLLNGAQLVRYIAYIKGSRRDDDDTLTSLSPEFFAGRNQPRSVGNTTILTIANNKGGVGKTTTAYYLGVELAKQGKRVLLIDLDGQANLTERCLPKQITERSEEGEQFPNIAQYFAGEHRLDELIVPSETQDGVSLIPADPFLRLRDVGGSGRPDIESRFVHDVERLCTRQVASLGGTPEWIVIDTPPAMSVFTRAGLAAATHVLAPIRARRASLTGTRIMLTTLRTMSALVEGGAIFLGVVFTHWDDLKATQNFEDVDLPPILQGFGGRAFATKIPFDNQLETLEPGARTRGARAYEALAAEVMQHVNQRDTARSDSASQAATVRAQG